MQQRIRDMRNDLTKDGGMKTLLIVPKAIYHRIRALTISDDTRSTERVFYKDKLLECLVTGMEVLESQEKEKE